MTGLPLIRPVALAALAALVLHLALPADAYLFAIVPLILVFGMPHGALDLVLARQTWPLVGGAHHAAFLLGYLAIAAAVAGLWYLAPEAALLAFLGYSAYHFSDDWPGPRFAAVAAAVVVLALPAALHPVRVDALFGWLGAEGGVARPLLVAAGGAGLPVALWTYRRSPVRLGLLLGLAGLAALLPPLGYFFVYFCGLHGPGHVGRVAGRLRIGSRDLWRSMLAPTAGALLATAAAALALLRTGIDPDEAALRATFIAFAALTVPHMLLVDLFSRGRARA